MNDDYARGLADALEVQRRFNDLHNLRYEEMKNSSSVSEDWLRFLSGGREWPEIVYEDVLDMEVLDD